MSTKPKAKRAQRARTPASGSPSNVDLVAAALCHQRKGATTIVEREDGDLEFPIEPSDDDIDRILADPPEDWEEYRDLAAKIVRRVVETEPRDLLDTVSDIAGIAKRGHDALHGMLGIKVLPPRGGGR